MTDKEYQKIQDVFLLDRGDLLLSVSDLIGVKVSGSKQALVKDCVKSIRESVLRQGESFLFIEIRPMGGAGSSYDRYKIILLGERKFYNIEMPAREFVKHFMVYKNVPQKLSYKMHNLSEEDQALLK